MRRDPFDVLGVHPTSSPSAVRAAFRALALRHHPDRNPGDPGASARFVEIFEAYQSLCGSGRARSSPSGCSSAMRSRGAEGRWICPRCHGRFVYPASCPQCERALEDTNAGVQVVASSASGANAPASTFERELERRAAAGTSATVRAIAGGVPIGLPALSFVAALLVAWLGPIDVALMFAGFGSYIATLEAHARLRAL
jgi:hypothetical protein